MKRQLLTQEAINDLDLDAKSRIESVKTEKVHKPVIRR